MKWVYVVIAIAFLVLFQFVYSGFFLHRGSQLAKVEFTETKSIGDPTDPAFTVLVDGDSVAAGVGASTFDMTLGARIATELGNNHYVTITNQGKSGQRMVDLTQPQQTDLTILIIGSNDLFHFTNLDQFRAHTQRVLQLYASQAVTVILLGPADIPGAPAVPFLLKPFYTMQWPKYAAIVEEESSSYKNVIFINPREYKKYIDDAGNTRATDQFHPNDLWYEIVAGIMIKRYNEEINS